jgi:hypothetical protein
MALASRAGRAVPPRAVEHVRGVAVAPGEAVTGRRHLGVGARSSSRTPVYSVWRITNEIHRGCRNGFDAQGERHPRAVARPEPPGRLGGRPRAWEKEAPQPRVFKRVGRHSEYAK